MASGPGVPPVRILDTLGINAPILELIHGMEARNG